MRVQWSQSEGRIWIVGNRLRDNGAGGTVNFSGLDDYPDTINNYTTDSADAVEYVSTGANGDFRIKNTASLVWGKGFGAGDQPASGGGGRIIGG